MSKVHHWGKVVTAAKKLASKLTFKSTKSKAGQEVAVHKPKYHFCLCFKKSDLDMSLKGLYCWIRPKCKC